ncbi:MAG: 2-hydroxyacyl-CoA dehydratase family protein [Actinomycetota bacterium]|nr:2-hydroxyacyl-CoA dehydratase family protein [Actinomycetota bacterium]
MGKRPKLPCEDTMKEAMTAYYTEAFTSDRPKAWVTSGAPVELLLAADVIPIFPENYGAMIGAQRLGGDLCSAAGDLGFDDCVCSYARCTIASTERGEGPLGALPAPDLLLACNNGCGTMFKWYEVLSRRFGVPLLFFDTPYCDGEPTPRDREYLVRQLERILAELGDILGREVDRDRLWETLRLSSDTARLWSEIQELRKARPCPLNSPDMFLHMALIVTLRGTETAYRYYQEMLAQVRERVEAGIGAVEDERYRLLWDHIPPWYALRDFFGFCAELGACFAVDTYTNVWQGEFDPDRPLESLAECYQRVMPNLRLPWRAAMYVDYIRDYAIDGFVIHSNHSCKSYCLGEYEIARRVTAETGVRGVILEADMVDPKFYSESQVKQMMAAFLESLD